MKRNLVVTLVAVFLALNIGGCIEVKRQYTINPDFSGKVTVFSVSSLDNIIQGGAGGDQTDEEKSRRAAKKMLENTSGVETWKDLSYRVTDEGKFEFRGTAYFKDFNALNLNTTITSSNKFILAGEGGGTVLRWVAEQKDEGETKKKVPPLTGAALEKQIKIEKSKFKESYGMMQAMLSGFKEEDAFVLPGEKKTVKGFATHGPSVVIAINGDEALEAIKKLSANDEFWRKTVSASKDPLKNDSEELQTQLFGATLPFEAVYAGGKNQFDYAAEADAAKEAFPMMVETLGIAPKQTLPPAELSVYSKFKSLRLAAVNLVFESDAERGIRPNNQEKGCTLYLIGELPGPAQGTGEVEVTEALGDDGQSLLNDQSNFGSFSSPQLSEDKGAVIIPIALKLPDQKVKRIKKLAGTVALTIVTGALSHDSGTLTLAKGSKGKEYGLEIVKVAKDKQSPNTTNVVLKLKISSDLLTGVSFHDEEGKIIDHIGSSSSCLDDDCKMEYTFDVKLPKKLSIVIDAYESVSQVKTTFELKDVELTGAK